MVVGDKMGKKINIYEYYMLGSQQFLFGLFYQFLCGRLENSVSGYGVVGIYCEAGVWFYGRLGKSFKDDFIRRQKGIVGIKEIKVEERVLGSGSRVDSVFVWGRLGIFEGLKEVFVVAIGDNGERELEREE